MKKRPVRLTPIGGVLLCVGFSLGAVVGLAGSYTHVLAIEKAAVGIRADLASRSIEPADQTMLRDLIEQQKTDHLRIEKLEKSVAQLR